MAEFQFDHETQDGRHFAASAEVCRPELLLPGQVELARRAFEKFLGGLAMLFPAYLYLPAEIRFAGAAQQPLTHALREAGSGPCTVFLELSSFQNSAYLALGHNFVSTALELLLGAPAEVTGTPRQSLTEVDLHVLQGLLERVVDELRGAWQSTCGASLRLVSTDLAEPFAGAPPDGRSVLVLTAEIILRESAATISLMVPSVLVRLASEQVRESITAARRWPSGRSPWPRPPIAGPCSTRWTRLLSRSRPFSPLATFGYATCSASSPGRFWHSPAKQTRPSRGTSTEWLSSKGNWSIVASLWRFKSGPGPPPVILLRVRSSRADRPGASRD